jgi:hypothetical protein
MEVKVAFKIERNTAVYTRWCFLFFDPMNLTQDRCYCEENIWKLCEQLLGSRKPSIQIQQNLDYVVFISNKSLKVNELFTEIMTLAFSAE